MVSRPKVAQSPAIRPLTPGQITHYERSPWLEERLRVWASLQGLCPRTPRIYRLMPLPMLGLLRMDEKEGCQSIPYRSVEATEAVLRLLPGISLSSAQSGPILLRRDEELHLRGGF